MIKQDQKTQIEVRQKVQKLLAQLCTGLYEREDSIRLALLSAVAGESIFLLGPPGVGKSLIARRLKYAFKDGVSFEYLMSKFSTPDEIFGPVSIKKLKDEDKYERLTDRYLPSANIVFLDEIWKAGPAIQNSLLTILNEKIYRNGEKDMKVNIQGIITASNELPGSSSSLAPIWDRFLIRLELGNIQKPKNFLNMIVDTKDVYHDDVEPELKLTQAEIAQWSAAIKQIEVPAEVLNTIQVVKLKIDKHNQKPNNTPIRIHDRRWKKIIQLLRTSAFLNGRKEVDLMDCFLMEHCLWNQPDQKQVLQEIISETIRKHGYSMAVNLSMLRKEIKDFEQDIDQEIKVKHTQSEDVLMPVQEFYYELEKAEEKFSGALVPIKQFHSLTLDNKDVVNFHDHDLNLVNRLSSSKSEMPNAIDVYHNSVKHTIPLKTSQEETQEVIYKAPHPVLEKYWEERHQQLSNYIAEQEKAISEGTPKQLAFLEENLFVDSELSEIVKANMEEVHEALQKFKLRLEKLQYSYASLKHQ